MKTILILVFFMAFGVKGFTQSTFHQQDSIVMAKTIDSLKKVIAKKDKNLAYLQEENKKLLSVDFSNELKAAQELRLRDYFILTPEEYSNGDFIPYRFVYGYTH
jgi:hypothetical protein